MSFIKDFVQRGYFYQCTNLEELEKISNSKQITAYIGFDCTAKSLHVGNLMQIMILRLLQKYGHKPIIIIGDGTSRVGDPTGKDAARRVLTPEELNENIAGIKKSLSKFIKFGTGSSDALMVTNSTWLSSIGWIEFLCNYGSLISVNRMLSMESVKQRLEREQPLSFLEFNYMLLQAYDFYTLHKEYNCSLQIGGSDQWGNIVMGTELTRKITGNEVYGLTTPLLTTSSGVKMGKSISGAVWVNEEQLSPYDYYQFWRNTEDADVLRFAKLYAEFNDSELEDFAKLAGTDINAAKKTLAVALTKLCHGEHAANQALNTATRVFEEGELDDNLPTVLIEKQRLEIGVPAFELAFESGLTETKSDARRLIRGNGFRVNDEKVLDENMLINISMMEKNEAIKLSSGKKKHILVKLA